MDNIYVRRLDSDHLVPITTECFICSEAYTRKIWSSQHKCYFKCDKCDVEWTWRNPEFLDFYTKED